MPIILGGDFLNLVRTYRTLWMTGNYGGGKTSLCYRIAWDLVANYDYKYLLTNCSDIWSDNFGSVSFDDDNFLRLVILLDEAGLFLKTGRDVDDFLAFMAKMDTILLCPSIEPPPLRVRRLTCQLTWKLTSLGIPAWLYSWRLSSGAIKESGTFVWYNPSEIFGVYSRRDPVTDDGGISEFLESKIDEYLRYYGRTNRRTFGSMGGDGNRSQEALIEALSGLQESLEAAKTVSTRKNKR